VVDIQVTQGEGGEGTRGENDVRRNRTSVVGSPFGAIGVDYCKASCGGFAKAIRGEEVKCHDVSPPKKTWKEGNS